MLSGVLNLGRAHLSPGVVMALPQFFEALTIDIDVRPEPMVFGRQKRM